MNQVVVYEDERDTQEHICALCCEILTGLETEHTIFPFSSAKELAAAPDGRERFELLYMDIHTSVSRWWTSRSRPKPWRRNSGSTTGRTG